MTTKSLFLSFFHYFGPPFFKSTGARERGLNDAVSNSYLSSEYIFLVKTQHGHFTFASIASRRSRRRLGSRPTKVFNIILLNKFVAKKTQHMQIN